MVHYLPMRRDAHPNPADSRQKRGLEVLEQMFAYFDYAVLPFVQQDDSNDYDYSRAA